MAAEIKVPTLGESVTEAVVAKWLKAEGDSVAADEAVVELETDKVTLEVNAPEAGTLAEIAAQEGDSVEVGALLGRIGEGAGKAPAPAAAPAPAPAPAPAAAPAPAPAPAAAPAPASGGGKTHDVPVPTLGESVTEAVVAKWLKRPGDSVGADEAILELETDKVSLEVNAPVAGTLAEALVEEGATVEVGALLARVAEGGGAAAPAPAPAPAPAAAPAPAPASAPAAAPSQAVQAGDTGAGTATGALDDRGQAPGEGADLAAAPGLDPGKARRTDGKVTASDLMAFLGEGAPSSAMTLSPAVARLVEQHGLDPYRIPATGPQGRLTKEDVEAVAAGRVALKPKPSVGGGAAAPGPAKSEAAAPAPAPAASAEGQPRERRERMSKLRQTIAKRLKESQNNAAMLTTFNEADMSAVMDLRSRYKDGFEKKHGVKLGFTAFFAKACVKALKEVPAVNARIDGTDIVYNQFYDIGMAVSAPQGLMVPVIRDCDGKSFAEIEQALGELAGRARDGKLGLDEMQGGSFTITNGGVFGSLVSTPILNAPQSGILGLHKIQERPVAIGGKVEVRPMMYLALSYDHRIVDGREAVTFLVKVKEAIEDPERLLLDL